MMSPDLVFRIIGDDSGVPAVVTRTSAQIGKLPGTTGTASRGFDQMTRSSKLSADQMRQLSFQTNDFS